MVVTNQFTIMKIFNVGDVVSLYFKNKGLTFFFEGLCIAIKKKTFTKPELIFILRNVLGNVGIEMNISYFYNLIFSFRLINMKRKKHVYRHSKIYYIRNKLNRESRIS